MNGDGFDDIIVGAYYASPGTDYAGAAYVVFGGEFEEGTATVNLADLDRTNGFAITGETEEGYLGMTVASAGDVNGDGFDDVVLAERGAFDSETLTYSGSAYVIFGDDFNGTAGTIGTSGNDTLAGGTGSVVHALQGDDRIEVANSDFFRIDGRYRYGHPGFYQQRGHT